ncbi:MAG TPA: HAMP domain-containing sensor histidine kinase [Bacteroidia bacterium]|nr:HAMP domain-containing sensor histidine kinase [Bacteroidia bacterium]
MKTRSRPLIILIVLFSYVVLQFLWWEILLVKQSGQIIDEKQKILALSLSDADKLETELQVLRSKRTHQTFMIVGEGTVFLLLLLYGLYRIKKAQDKEAELMRQQNNFFLSITHELKTPLAATKLQLQTLQKQKPGQALQTELIANALEETERLNALIDNVLLAARMESSEFRLNKQTGDPGEWLRQICERYFSQELRSARLVLQCESLHQAAFDQVALTSMLTNLVNNALKYSAPDTQVKVIARQRDYQTIIQVCDHGQGIPDQEKEKVFRKFYRLGSEETRRSKGTGLGLYIVKKLADAQGIKVSVSDNQPHGSIFSIVLNAV